MTFAAQVSRLALPSLTLMCAFIAFAPRASAQFSDQFDREQASPEHFALQLGVGMYHPSSTASGSTAFEQVFGDDQGPLIHAEFEVFAYRIPYVGPIGAAVGSGIVQYKGAACIDAPGGPDCGGSTSDRSKLRLVPLTVSAMLRIDTLARHTPVPLIFKGKVGLDTIFFSERTGASGATRGQTYGLRWAAEVALELNALARTRANALDSDWGINSSYLFFELNGSQARSSVPLGDSLAWLAGLGLTF